MLHISRIKYIKTPNKYYSLCDKLFHHQMDEKYQVQDPFFKELY